MNDQNEGCCTLPWTCGCSEGRCKLREEWQEAQKTPVIKTTYKGTPSHWEADPARWTKEDRAARVAAQVAAITAEEQAKANDPTRDRGRGMRR